MCGVGGPHDGFASDLVSRWVRGVSELVLLVSNFAHVQTDYARLRVRSALAFKTQ